MAVEKNNRCLLEKVFLFQVVSYCHTDQPDIKQDIEWPGKSEIY